MNLFREVRLRPRRSSSASNNGEEADEAARSSSFISNGHASLRRRFQLPRSRTTTQVNPGVGGAKLPASATSNSINDNSKATTDWSYCRPPPKPSSSSRSASLGRNVGRIKSSITVPNFKNPQEDAPPETGTINNSNFSTFRCDPSKDSVIRSCRRRPRPLSADVTGQQQQQRAPPPPVPPRRKSVASSSDNNASLESLLDDHGNYIITTTNELDNVTGGGSLDLLNEADEDLKGRSSNKRGQAGGSSSLDSLLDNDLESNNSNSTGSAASSLSMRNRPAAPASAFGSIQLKVQEIRDQLDVLKTGNGTSSSSSRGGGSTGLHRKPSSALQLFGLGSYFQSSSQDTADSMSPRSISPASSKQQPQQQLQPHPQQPPAKNALSNSSSSPTSTLSPCSSNSLTSSTMSQQQQQHQQRPQVLRLPQSNSFNCFSSAVAKNNGNRICKDDLDVNSVSQGDRMVFFLDILSTQDRIAKVRRWTCTVVVQGTKISPHKAISGPLLLQKLRERRERGETVSQGGWVSIVMQISQAAPLSPVIMQVSCTPLDRGSRSLFQRRGGCMRYRNGEGDIIAAAAPRKGLPKSSSYANFIHRTPFSSFCFFLCVCMGFRPGRAPSCSQEVERGRGGLLNRRPEERKKKKKKGYNARHTWHVCGHRRTHTRPQHEHALHHLGFL